MADNVGYTPGSGATVAADEIGGVLHQRVKIGVGADGTAVDVSSTNPMPVDVNGEMIEAIEALRMAIASLTRTIGIAMPDTVGRLRVLAENPTAANLNATVSGTITANQGGTWNIATLTNQTQVGGFNANDQIPALMQLNAGSLRRNISVT